MPTDTIALLATSDLLAGVPERRLAEIRDDLVETNLREGDVLFRQGDVGDAVYLVQDGEIRVEIDGVTVVKCYSGQWLGEIALVDQLPRSATAVAGTEAVLLRWDRARFQSILARDAQVATGIFRVLSAKLRHTTESTVRLKSEQERIRQDLRRAREIQEAMLPNGGMRTPGVEVAGACRPATEVGGDYFDYVPLPGGRVGVILGDVTGHGFYSALFVAMAKSCLVTQLRTNFEPEAVMAAMADTVNLSIRRGLLMTCCYMVLDPENGVVEYANAGHPHPYLLRHGSEEFEQLEILDPLLGVQDLYGGGFQKRQIEWGAGDLLMVYSDGMIEARDESGAMFGAKALTECLRESRREPAERVVQVITERVIGYHGSRAPTDDMSLVVARAT